MPGPPAPWSALPPAARSRLSLAAVRAVLAHPVDIDRQRAVVRESAVLAPLFDEDGEARVVLTRRASTLRSHRSEVSFPGGRVDPGETLTGAALREAWEEIALDPSTVEIIGTLTPLATMSSAALIHPFVGVLPGRPTLRANPSEVELVFDVALADLLVPGVHHTERWAIAGLSRDLHFFELPGDIVWGATGRLLWELLTRVTGTVPDPAPEDGPLP
ncbi:MAG: hypothetical protein NVSMB16_07190 [Acidimicrobiales bacterium]